MFGEDQNAEVRARQQKTFTSSVFGEPIDTKSGRPKLGGESKGSGVLFGNDKADF